MSGMGLGLRGGTCIVDSLPVGIRHLNLDDNFQSENVKNDCSVTLKHSFLSTPPPSPLIAAFCRSLRNALAERPTFTSLSMKGSAQNKLEHDIIHIFRVIKHTPYLTFLDVRYHECGPDAFEILCRALSRNKVIRTVYAEGNNIAYKGYFQARNTLINNPSVKLTVLSPTFDLNCSNSNVNSVIQDIFVFNRTKCSEIEPNNLFKFRLKWNTQCNDINKTTHETKTRRKISKNKSQSMAKLQEKKKSSTKETELYKRNLPRSRSQASFPSSTISTTTTTTATPTTTTNATVATTSPQNLSSLSKSRGVEDKKGLRVHRSRESDKKNSRNSIWKKQGSGGGESDGYAIRTPGEVEQPKVVESFRTVEENPDDNINTMSPMIRHIQSSPSLDILDTGSLLLSSDIDSLYSTHDHISDCSPPKRPLNSISTSELIPLPTVDPPLPPPSDMSSSVPIDICHQKSKHKQKQKQDKNTRSLSSPRNGVRNNTISAIPYRQLSSPVADRQFIDTQHTPTGRNENSARHYRTSSISVSVGSPIIISKSSESSRNFVHNRFYSQVRNMEYNCESLRRPLVNTNVNQSLGVVESCVMTEEKEIIQKEKTERLIEVNTEGEVESSSLSTKQTLEQEQQPQYLLQPQLSYESIVKPITVRRTTLPDLPLPPSPSPRVLGLHNDRLDGTTVSSVSSNTKLRKEIDVQKENRSVPSDALEAYLQDLQAQQFTTQPWT
eukprot:TRINITY_DN1388_c1_g2_i1.p1 TRINITY_DN1388_c1_g2~~TRINITY_DN1388_c1_g2_i1.p1  ORF type:complete len:809 (-),score=163.27 TRINITY_DN1388_c1_g2_i1:128-2296(-)